MAKTLRHWTWLAPAFAWLLFLMSLGGALPPLLLGTALFGTVLAAVHHAELIAHRVGEPFGTFLLAVAVTIIELGLIITLMSAGGASAATLARDTVFAAVMIILNGLVGVCILIGAIRHKEQNFQQTGVSASLATICALTVLTLVLPNFTISEPVRFMRRRSSVSSPSYPFCSISRSWACRRFDIATTSCRTER